MTIATRFVLTTVLLLISGLSHAAIAFVAVDSADDGTAITVVTNKPTGTLEGHTMFAIFSAGNSTIGTRTVTEPSGWTEIDDAVDTSGKDRLLWVGYKVAGASEPSTYTWDLDAGLDAAVRATIITLSGVDTTTPLDVTYVRANHHVTILNDADMMTPAAITTATDEAWVLLMQAITHDDITAAGPPTGYTNRYATTSGTLDRQHYISNKEITTAGLETPGAYSHTENGSNANEGTVFTLAIKPAAAVDPDEYLIKTRRARGL